MDKTCHTCSRNCVNRGKILANYDCQFWINQKPGSIYGVGPEAETVQNEQGGKQSATPYGFDCLDVGAIFATAKVLEEGRQKYGKGNWLKIPPEDHANHLLMHVFAWMAGDTSDEHLAHAMCRAMMLYATASKAVTSHA